MMISLTKKTSENVIGTVSALVDFFNLKVTYSTITNTLKSHPDYPSLLSISDSLSQWKINHDAYKIEASMFSEEYFPLVAHLRSEGGKFIFLKSATPEYFIFDDENGKNQKIVKSDFFKQWSGIVLQPDADAESGETSYRAQRNKEIIQASKTPLLILFLSILLISYISQQTFIYTLYSVPMLIAKMIGLTVSILLLIQSIDANNPFVKNLCAMSKKNNCNAILKSDAAKITSWLSWSEIGFAYFSITGLILLLDINASTTISILFVATLLCIPYTLYSIYYQSQIAKQWCVLCCIVQGVFWLELGIALPHLVSSDISFSGLFTYFHWYHLFLFTPIVLWSFTKGFFQKAMQLPTVKQQLKQFKFNGELFDTLLKKQSFHNVDVALMPLQIGNPKATTVITMVSNPFCGPCAKAHLVLENWLQQRNDILVQTIFTGTTMDKESMVKIRKHLVMLSTHPDKQFVAETLSSWYALSTKKYDTWEFKDSIFIDDEQVTKAMELQAQWCDEAMIAFTPTILVNGYRMPEQYRLEDIQYLI